MEQGEQIKTGGVQRIAAQRHRFSAYSLRFDLKHIVYSQAVLQTVHAPGIFRDIPTDGTGNLRRRIRGVIETVRRSCLGDSKIPYPRLYPRIASGRVDFKNFVEAR